MTAFDSTFQAAIPGSSLTHKMGSLPHEKPPKYVDPNDALEYFWKQLTRPNIMQQIWQLYKQGVTIWEIARALLYKAALEGLIQINLAILLEPTLGKMLYVISQAGGVNAKVAPDFKNKQLDALINIKLKELIQKYSPPKPAPFQLAPGAPPIVPDAPIPENANVPQDATVEEQPPQSQGLLGLGGNNG